MPRRAVIKLAHVNLDLDGKRVLSDVNWEVMEGENWVVIGPNGAGKTSLISIINAYRWPSDGRVTILGRTFGEADLRELRTRTGIVSSYLDGMIPKNERVIDLVMSGKFGATRLWSKIEAPDREYATSLLRLMGCLDYRDRKMRELSQGERQKAVIARALMPKPRLLTLDEPCEGLDIAARETFLDGLQTLVGRKMATIVEITHRTDDIPPGFTHTLLLREGRVVAQGDIAATLTSRNLSLCFGVDVKLKKWGGRYYTLVSPR